MTRAIRRLTRRPQITRRYADKNVGCYCVVTCLRNVKFLTGKISKKCLGVISVKEAKSIWLNEAKLAWRPCHPFDKYCVNFDVANSMCVYRLRENVRQNHENIHVSHIELFNYEKKSKTSTFYILLSWENRRLADFQTVHGLGSGHGEGYC